MPCIKENWEAGSPRVVWQLCGIMSSSGFDNFALPSLAFLFMVQDGYRSTLEGKMERKNGKSEAESCSLNCLSVNTTHHFYLDLIGQNLVTWPHQAAKEAGKCAIFIFTG